MRLFEAIGNTIDHMLKKNPPETSQPPQPTTETRPRIRIILAPQDSKEKAGLIESAREKALGLAISGKDKLQNAPQRATDALKDEYEMLKGYAKERARIVPANAKADLANIKEAVGTELGYFAGAVKTAGTNIKSDAKK
jgi:hypothetical protein